MLSEEGKVYLIDFGCCSYEKFVTKDRSGANNCRAPEIHLKDESVKVNWRMNDIWTIGCLCYEIVGEEYPFNYGSYSRDGFIFPKEDYPIIYNITKGCLQTDPKNRWSVKKLMNYIEYKLWFDDKEDISIQIKDLCLSLSKSLQEEATFGRFAQIEKKLKVEFIIKVVSDSLKKKLTVNSGKDHLIGFSSLIEKIVSFGFDELKAKYACSVLVDNGKFLFDLEYFIDYLLQNDQRLSQCGFKLLSNLSNKTSSVLWEESEMFKKEFLNIRNFDVIKKIGKSKTKKEIGQYGANSFVYLVRYYYTGKFYALKVLYNKIGNSIFFTNDLRRELEYTISEDIQQHENIINLYGCFRVDIETRLFPNWPKDITPVKENGEDADRSLCVLVELCDCNLAQYVRKYQNRINRECVLRILIQLCSSISHLVKNNVLHGDIKLDNLFVIKKFGDIKIVLADFGCHVKVNDISCVSSDILPLIRGNTAYKAYELFPSSAVNVGTEVDLSRSEIWSLGLLGIDLILNKYPFDILPKEWYGKGDYKIHRDFVEEHLHFVVNHVKKEKKMFKDVVDVLFNFLRKDITKRPCAEDAYLVLNLLLFGPKSTKKNDLKCWEAVMKSQNDELSKKYFEVYNRKKDRVLDLVKIYHLEGNIRKQVVKEEVNIILRIPIKDLLLPNEIFIEMFLFLDLSSLVSVFCCCKRFYNIFKSQTFLKKYSFNFYKIAYGKKIGKEYNNRSRGWEEFLQNIIEDKNKREKNLRRLDKRINKEIELFKRKKSEDKIPHILSLTANGYFLINAIILGPEGSDYEGKEFHISIELPENYPYVPLVLRFRDSIDHPSVNPECVVFMDILLPKFWNHSKKIVDVLDSLFSIMNDPDLGLKWENFS